MTNPLPVLCRRLTQRFWKTVSASWATRKRSGEWDRTSAGGQTETHEGCGLGDFPHLHIEEYWIQPVGNSLISSAPTRGPASRPSEFSPASRRASASMSSTAPP